MAAHTDATVATDLAARIDVRTRQLTATAAIPAAELADLLLDARLAAAACGPIGDAAMRCVDVALASTITGRGLVPATEARELLAEIGAALRVAAVAAELATAR